MDWERKSARGALEVGGHYELEFFYSANVSWVLSWLSYIRLYN